MAMTTTIQRLPLLGALAIFLLPIVACSCASTPSLTSISPTSAPAGSPDVTLTINGNNFSSNSVVAWNGTSLASSFVSSTQLTATIPASDIAQPETVYVYVYNPANGSKTVSEGTTSAATQNTCNVASSKPDAFTVNP
jgi:hypothetical protein